MRIAILLFICTLILIKSSRSQIVGLYIGEVESGIKHLSSKTLKLEKESVFELTCKTTSLEALKPSTIICVLKGSYKIVDDELILFPLAQKINWLSYSKNSKILDSNLNVDMRSAWIVLDTSYGQVQIIEDLETIKFKLTNKPNSQYLWNDENCFMRYIDAETSNDLKNYCSDLKMK